DSARSLIALMRYRSSMVNARFCCATAVAAANAANRQTACFMARMLSSYDSALHGMARTSVCRMERHLHNVANVDAGRRQDPHGEDAADQPLVARHAVRDLARPRYLADSRRRAHVRDRLRLSRAPADDRHHGR